jgi:hypothetical protein
VFQKPVGFGTRPAKTGWLQDRRFKPAWDNKKRKKGNK